MSVADRSQTERIRRMRAQIQAVRRTDCFTCLEEGPQGPVDQSTRVSRKFGQQIYYKQNAVGAVTPTTCCTNNYPTYYFACDNAYSDNFPGPLPTGPFYAHVSGTPGLGLLQLTCTGPSDPFFIIVAPSLPYLFTTVPANTTSITYTYLCDAQSTKYISPGLSGQGPLEGYIPYNFVNNSDKTVTLILTNQYPPPSQTTIYSIAAGGSKIITSSLYPTYYWSTADVSSPVTIDVGVMELTNVENLKSTNTYYFINSSANSLSITFTGGSYSSLSLSAHTTTPQGSYTNISSITIS